MAKTNRLKTIFAVVLAIALFAVPASAQVSPTEDADSRIAMLEELVQSQEELINEQRALINKQENLLNAYRCMFEVDVEVVPGGCSGLELTEEEVADGVVMCAGWRAEAQDTQFVAQAWTSLASGLEQGIIPIDGEQLANFFAASSGSVSDSQAVIGNAVEGYHARVLAIIPNLSSERITGLMQAMADSIQAVNDTFSGGGTADELAAAIRTALDQLSQLNAALAEICA